jgi:Cu+-exporting ATPase
MTELAVSGMTCASCVSHVGKALRKVPGVQDAEVNLATERASVSHDPTVAPAALIAAIEHAGYGARIVQEGAESEDQDARAREAELSRKRALLLLAIALCVPTLVLGMTPIAFAGKDWVLLLLTLPVWLVVGYDFHRGAVAALAHGTANMDTLVSLGSTAAFGYSVYATLAMRPSYYETASAIVTLIFAGKYLEAAAKSRSNLAIRSLLDLRPPMARVRRADGSIEEIRADAVRAGDLLIVAAGERIPVDGVVEEGESEIDASMLTGEPLPVPATTGASVKQGTMNGDGTLLVRAQAVGTGTALARIIELVRRAQGTTPPVQRVADRVAGIFVPVILLITAMTFAAWTLTGHTWSASLPIAIAVLVVACPCALGLATPMAVIAGVGLAARHGLLFRDAEAMERLSSVRTVLFDKTGTLTAGKPHVERIETLDGVAADDMLAQAAAIESGSLHPLARALVEEAHTRGVTIPPAQNVRIQAGAGISGSIAGAMLYAGNAAYVRRAGANVDSAALANTRIYLARENAALGWFDFSDAVRPESASAIQRLHALGVRTGIVSGDAEAPTKALAAQLGIEIWHAPRSPEQKAQTVARERERARTAFVGDGINDAPALATADVGIAMGAGSEVALQTAQAAILSNDPRAIAAAVEISRATLQKIYQNLFWAFAYNAVLVPLAAVGKIHPIFAAAAMGASSLFVAGNSYLLQRRRLSSNG